jgi:zinc protease
VKNRGERNGAGGGGRDTNQRPGRDAEVGHLITYVLLSPDVADRDVEKLWQTGPCYDHEHIVNPSTRAFPTSGRLFRLLLAALAAGVLFTAAPGSLSAVAPQAGRLPAPSPPTPTRPRPMTSPDQPTGPLAEPAPFVSQRLANGLDVVVLADHSIPLVTVELAVRNGSFTEPPELNGLSHLYEHMFFKSNRATLDRAAYLRDIDQLGIIYNGTTQEEVVEYYFTTTSPNFQVAMRFMRDSVMYPAFDEREFANEREVVVGEIDRNESNPFSVVSDEMNKRLFFKYPSRKRPIGNRETVRSATTDMMRLIKGRYYVPNNSAVIITGDVEPQAAFKVAEDLFGEWARRARDPFEEFPLVEHPPLPKSEAAILTKPVQNVIVSLGWQGPSMGKDDVSTYSADVFSFILRQPDSRFQRTLVDSGLAAGATLGYYSQRNVGPINAMLQTTPDKARAAVRALYDEIAHFNDPNYFTDAELDSAKALLEADDLYQREKLSSYTHVIGFWWSSAGLDYYRGYLKRLRATSRADISRYITTYIQGKPHVGLAILSPESLKASALTEPDLIGPASPEPAEVR